MSEKTRFQREFKFSENNLFLKKNVVHQKTTKKKGNFKILKLHFRALMFALYFNSDIILVEMKIKKQSSFKSLILKKARTSG